MTTHDDHKPKLPPIVVPFLGSVLEHGERAEHDPAHPGACYCGVLDYLDCFAYISGDNLGSWTIHPAQTAQPEGTPDA